MGKTMKAMTLEDEVIGYIEEMSQVENRNFSNMVNVIIKRYKRISEQLDQGLKIDTSFAK